MPTSENNESKPLTERGMGAVGIRIYLTNKPVGQTRYLKLQTLNKDQQNILTFCCIAD